MRVFDDEPAPPGPRAGADWEQHRRARQPRTGPPRDEVGVPALTSFVLGRGRDTVVAVRGVRACSDGLVLGVVLLFADEQPAGDVERLLAGHDPSPGRFRLGVVLADGSRATTGGGESPELLRGGPAPVLTLQSSRTGVLEHEAEYWLWPLPPPGTLYVACRWQDRGIEESVVAVDAGPLLAAAATSTTVWSTA